VTLVGSAELASLAESALSGNDVSDHDIAAELAPCFVGDGKDRTDTIVLACTHYPLLMDRRQGSRRGHRLDHPAPPSPGSVRPARSQAEADQARRDDIHPRSGRTALSRSLMPFGGRVPA
jgi:glutamate racemase